MLTLPVHRALRRATGAPLPARPFVVRETTPAGCVASQRLPSYAETCVSCGRVSQTGLSLIAERGCSPCGRRGLR